MATFIKAGGKERPVFFGWGALMDFEERTGIDVFEMLEKWSAGNLQGVKIKHLVELFHSGFLNGCEDAGIEPDFTLKNVANWLSEPGLQSKLQGLLQGQMPKNETGSEGEAKAAKSKK